MADPRIATGDVGLAAVLLTFDSSQARYGYPSRPVAISPRRNAPADAQWGK
jgi:hypothetical protein